MRILDLAQHFDRVSRTHGPHRRDEVAEAVDGKQRRALERRDEETTREMRQVMFDVVKLRAQVSPGNVEHTRQFIPEIADFCGVGESILGLAKNAEARSRVQYLLVQVRRRIPRDADVVHLFDAHARLLQTVTNRLLGKAGAVLDAIEPFFFDRGDQSAVFDDCR